MIMSIDSNNNNYYYSAEAVPLHLLHLFVTIVSLVLIVIIILTFSASFLLSSWFSFSSSSSINPS